MLKLFDKNHNAIGHITKYKDCKIESDVSTGDKTLSFVYLARYHRLENEMYVQTEDDEYVIKEASADSGGFPQIVAVLNLEGLQEKAWQTFSVTDATIDEAARTALAGSGWTVGYCDVTKRRNAGMMYVNTLGVIQNLCKAFMCEPVYDTKKKTVSFYAKRGEDKGVYFLSGLNLRRLQKKSGSHEFYTRVIPIGENGLTIESVNDGKNYLENCQYSSKVLTYIWKDESYTDAQALMEDAGLWLEDHSKPEVSYQAEIRNLAAQKPGYSVLSYGPGDTVKIIDQATGTMEEQRIVKMVRYPDDPEKDTCEIANTVLTFEEMQEKYQEAAAIINYTVSGDGRYTGTISVSDILHFEDGLAGSSTIGGINSSITDIEGKLALTELTVGEITANYLKADEADLKYATIESLDATNIRVHNIEGDYASFKSLTTDEFASHTALIDKIYNEELVTAKGWMLEGSIGDAQISSVNANKLRAGTIDTAIVTVAGTDGRLQISDNTIQISDDSQVRVQMGKDASDDYTLAVWDADGNLIWDALGATENTIQRKIIRDKMVADDAAIQALKIDFQSFDTALTEQGVTISGTVVQVGSKTLNVALTEQTQVVTEHGELLTDHAAKIAANEKAISLRVTSQEFESYQTTTDGRLTDAESDIKSAAGRLSTTESSITALQGQIALKVEQRDIDKSLEGYSTTSQMNAAIELSKSGILTTVSDIYATQDNLEAAETIAEQTADKISWLVKNGTNSTNFTLTDRTATLVADTINANGLVRFSGLDSDTKERITTAQTTANEAAADVLLAQNTADEAGKRATYHYGTCATAASSAVKIVTLGGFTLYTGATVSVKFTYTNTAASPALNVNGTGAKTIYVYGASLQSSSVYNWAAGSTVQFVYNGTQWVMTDVSAMRAVADWCYSNNVSYINGAKIYAGTVTAQQINVTDLFAQDITATGTIRGVNLIGATGSFSGSVTATSGGIGSFSIGSDGSIEGSYGNQHIILSTNFIELWTGSANSQYHAQINTDGSIAANIIDVRDYITVYGAITSTNGNITCAGSVNAGYQLRGQSAQLSFSTPYIDFFYDSGANGRTSRIIESSKGVLNINGTSLGNGGTISTSGKIYTSGEIEVDSIVHLHNVYTYQSSEAANVRIGSTGRLARASSSSVRYKDLISVLSTEDVEALYDIPVRWFKYKADYLGEEDERYNKPIPGFVVEDWEDVLPIAIDHNPDGSPEMWNSNIVVPLMFQMIKNEHKRNTEARSSLQEMQEYGGRITAAESRIISAEDRMSVLQDQLSAARNEINALHAEIAEQAAIIARMQAA